MSMGIIRFARDAERLVRGADAAPYAAREREGSGGWRIRQILRG